MKMIDKALAKIKGPFALASVLALGGATEGCAAVNQTVCQPVNTIVLVRDGRHRRPVEVEAPMYNPDGTRAMRCHNQITFVPK